MVFVTKYRKAILTDELLTELETVFTSILKTRDGELLQFNGEKDHVHLLVSYKPSISVSKAVMHLNCDNSITFIFQFPSPFDNQFTFI